VETATAREWVGSRKFVDRCVRACVRAGSANSQRDLWGWIVFDGTKVALFILYTGKKGVGGGGGCEDFSGTRIRCLAHDGWVYDYGGSHLSVDMLGASWVVLERRVTRAGLLTYTRRRRDAWCSMYDTWSQVLVWVHTSVGLRMLAPARRLRSPTRISAAKGDRWRRRQQHLDHPFRRVCRRVSILSVRNGTCPGTTRCSEWWGFSAR
jgi:hypothetical protein